MKEVRLIDADSLVIEINAKIETLSSEENDRASAVCSALESVIDAITDAEKVDAEPVWHGRWIQVDDRKCKCSECEVITLIAQYPHGDKNYCPNCGAKMDGGAE